MTEQEEFEFRLRLERERGVTPPVMATHEDSTSQTMPRQPSSWGDVAAGGQKGLEDLWMGVKQRGTEMFGSQEAADALRQQVAEQRAAAEKEALLKGPPSLAFGLGEVGAKTVPLAAASFVPGGATLGGAALLGGVGGALEPTTSNKETLRNTGLGATSAFVTSLGARALMPKSRMTQDSRMMDKAAAREGVPLTGGQLTNLDYVKKAEAAAPWNPLTRWHAIPAATEQADYFIKGLLRRAGVKAQDIPDKPSLNPKIMKDALVQAGKELDFNFANKVYNGSQLNRAFTKAYQNSLYVSGSKEEQELVRGYAQHVLRFNMAGVNNTKFRGELLQQLIRDLDQGKDKLFSEGWKIGAEKIKELREAVVDSLVDPAQYREATETFANLKTVEELLRASPQMGRGIPDATRLGDILERNMPGSVIYNRSPLADLARAGEATAKSSALPERRTGIPRLSDIGNAMTYFRFNNPAARFGFRNPEARNITEVMARYLPFNVAESEPITEEAKQFYRMLRGEK